MLSDEETGPGGFPALVVPNIPGLTSKTDAAGTVLPSGAYGPYLVEMPDNPYTGSAAVKAIGANNPPLESDVTAGNTGGWIYDATTGQIWLDSDFNDEFEY